MTEDRRRALLRAALEKDQHSYEYALLPGEPYTHLTPMFVACCTDEELDRILSYNAWRWSHWAELVPNSWIEYCLARDSGCMLYRQVNIWLEAWGHPTADDALRWADDGGYVGYKEQ